MNRFGKVIICFVLLALMANGCKKDEGSDSSSDKNMRKVAEQNILEKLYGKDWYHSREEDKDSDGVSTYRDSSYKFPASRGGRHGFRMEEGGKYWEYGTGPTDRPTKTEGTWKVKEGTEAIEVKVAQNGTEMSYTLEFVSFEDNILKLKKMNE